MTTATKCKQCLKSDKRSCYLNLFFSSKPQKASLMIPFWHCSSGHITHKNSNSLNRNQRNSLLIATALFINPKLALMKPSSVLEKIYSPSCLNIVWVECIACDEKQGTKKTTGWSITTINIFPFFTFNSQKDTLDFGGFRQAAKYCFCLIY